MLVALIGVGIGFGVAQIGGSPSHGGAPSPSAPQSLSAIESGVAPWTLPVPVSRPVVLAAADNRSLIVAGGLDASGASAQAIVRLDPLTGSLTQLGSLAAATHDASGAVFDGAAYVFGGGSAAPTSSIQRLSDVASASAQSVASPIANLPQARADGVTVTIGKTAYVLGGYSGSASDTAVLATTNGRRFAKVAKLAVAVRYPAAAAIGSDIYVFGGNAASTSAGLPVRTIQVVDVKTGTSAVVGQLPEAIAAAAAVNLGGTIYLAGGDVPANASGSTVRAISSIYAWSPAAGRVLSAGKLFVPVAHAGVAVLGRRAWLVGGEDSSGAPTANVEMLEPNRAFGVAGTAGAGSPYYGDRLLVADRGNDRLLVLSDTDKILWHYPSKIARAPKGGFYFPDDAFFIRRGSAIISNQEENHTLVEIGYPSGKILWSYGHPRHSGSAPGYLNTPDDAYLLRNGDITVADAYNCRVLVIDPKTKSIVHQIGTSDNCAHNPPNTIYSPNGDTPLANGDLLVSEVTGSWVDEFTVAGRLKWSIQLPIAYPSDPQQVGKDRYLIADYAQPGAFIEFNRNDQVLYRFQPTSGPGELDHPSLVELLPSGVLMANDDYNDRIVAIDPATGAVVWQYGRTGVKGTAPGLLNTPDGFDLLASNGTFPTHPATG